MRRGIGVSEEEEFSYKSPVECDGLSEFTFFYIYMLAPQERASVKSFSLPSPAKAPKRVRLVDGLLKADDIR